MENNVIKFPDSPEKSEDDLVKDGFMKALDVGVVLPALAHGVPKKDVIAWLKETIESLED